MVNTAARLKSRHGTALASAKVQMLAATLTRMALGLVTFVLLARYLGPMPFGVIATAMAYTSFVGIVTDFGLGTAALRDAAAEPERTANLLANALAVKGLLTVVMVVAGGLTLALLMPPDRLLVYALVFVGALAYSFGDLMLVAARANQRFDLEASIVIGTSLVLLAGVGGVAALTASVTAVAAAFVVTRVGYLLVVATVLRRWLGNPLGRHGTDVIGTVRRASSYAADNLLTTLSAQIDVLLFGAVLSLHDVGIYQSGARLVQVILPFAVVLSTVYLPTLTASHARKDEKSFLASAQRLTWEFAGLAALSGIGFAVVGPILTKLFYGQRFAEVQPLWTGFAVFAILRFTAAAYGIQLVALGRIRPRIIAQLAGIGLFTITTFLIIPGAGLPATAWLLALSALPPFVLLSLALMQTGRAGAYVPISMLAVLAVAGALVLTRSMM